MSARLDPDDIDQIAQRVLVLLRADSETAQERLVDATTLAQLHSVTRVWVYAHAEELGAVRLGGPRGRLRFDLDLVRRLLQGGAPASARRRRRHGTKVTDSCADLLPFDP